MTYTINKDGSVKINGTSTVQTEVILNYKFNVKANVEYTIKCSERSDDSIIVYLFYKENGSNVYIIAGQWFSSKTFTLNKDTLCEVHLGVRPNKTINNEIVYPQINIGEVALPFEPYKNATIETNLKLADGDVYENSQITRARKQVVFDGSADEPWSYISSVGLVKTARLDIQINDKANGGSGYCDKFKITDAYDNNDYEHIRFSVVNNVMVVYIEKDKLESQDKNGFKTWLQTHPITVEYELAEPTTETLNIPTIPSYYPVTNVWTDNQISTEMEWELLANSDDSLKNEELERRILALEQKMIGG